MLRDLKLGALSSARWLGLTSLARNSGWRSRQLLILCYHGIALRDEHHWNPALYMEQSLFERRMAHLRRTRCNILPLTEALERLRCGELPERSVSITFDDGWHDFHELALPVLRRFEIPATVYLTTYYVGFNRPVFDTMLRYLLWKAAGRDLRAGGFIPADLTLDAAGTQAAVVAIQKHVKKKQLSGVEKDDLLATLAGDLDIDYDALLKQRLLHLMNRNEVRRASEAGVDIQMHTHRHRVSYKRELFIRELQENREEIASITGINPVHFCYPGGNFLNEYGEWLSAAGILSATTCELGLSSAKENPYFLPRFLDLSTTTEAEFEGWVSGLATLLPRRGNPPSPDQFLEDWAAQDSAARSASATDG